MGFPVLASSYSRARLEILSPLMAALLFSFFLAESILQNLPVVPSGLVIMLLGENLNDVHDGEEPGF
jgi:hypothetical protein